MTEMVDPLLFRLRAFEADWIEPLKSLLDREENDADSHSKLRLVLLLEAESWIGVAQKVGYFPVAVAPDESLGRVELRGQGLERHRRQIEFASFVFEPANVEVDMDAQEFAHALTQAQDDLTSEREEFLRLLYF